ncbi:hypothetical protein F5Y17DRAFT_451610 [Xylariaceae sp. FL0594]|nr:hypothetical protein F5Y17DRAFT_451610 [Xylariaceae sp. FL0594]
MSSDAEGVFSSPKTVAGAKSAARASIAALVVDDTLCAFYAHEDSSIHKLALVHGNWQDSQVKYTDDGTKKAGIGAIANDGGGGGYTLQYVTENKEVFTLNGQEEKPMKLGDIAEGGLKQATEAQCWGGPIIIIIIYY